MKRNLLSAGSLLLVLLSFFNVSKAQDLPGAAANFQTAPAGTIVIAMDNVNQACNLPTNGINLFNLKAYGLSIALLDMGYDLRWSIRAGKPKDGVDFSVMAERICDTYQAPAIRSFRAGPILIFPPDTLGIDYAVRYFNNLLPDSCKVKVYRTTSAVGVDVRYTLNKPPKAALFNDSCDIHRNFMEMASVPLMNYNCVSNASTLRTECYTIATDPHTMVSDLTSYDADSIYNFVMAGGNFLAECEGIKTFEALKRFQSLTGVTIDPPNPQSAQYNNTTNIVFENTDMAYAQFHGLYRPWTRGAVKLWNYQSATTNNFYSVVRSKRNADVSYFYAATVSKLTSDTGSVVFYLGNHEFYTHDCHTCTGGSVANQEEVNGIRMYLNAVLVPSKFMSCVNVWNIPLAVTLGSFTASKTANKTTLLNWTSLSEKDNAAYIIEHSVNGKDFTAIGEVAGRGDTDNGFAYQYIHNTPASGVNYYRLKMFSTTGKLTYSEIRMIAWGNQNNSLSIFPNPAKGSTQLLLDAKDGEKIQVTLLDLSGREIRTSTLRIAAQRTELPVQDLGEGVYFVIVKKPNGEQLKGKLVVCY